MATSLSQLRKNKSALMDKVNKALAGGDEKSYKEDERYWKPTRDSSGNGSAVIRFLPPVRDNDELPWVKIFSRSFQGPTGKYYINNDASTIGRSDDPVYQYTQPFYATGQDSDKKKVENLKRKTSFHSNILVIKDPANPANNGKVFLFKYGKKIHDMILALANPTFEDMAKIECWDIDEGANFHLRVNIVEKQVSYNLSTFAGVSPLAGGDEEEMQKVLDACHSLSELIDPKHFKSAEQLKKEFDRAMGFTNDTPVGKATDIVSGSTKPDPALDDIPVVIPEKPKAAKPQKEVPKAEESTPSVDSTGDDDDDMALFKSMLGKK